MNYRAELESLLTQLRKDQYQLQDDSLAPEIDGVTCKILDGAIALANAAQACRSAQKAYFKARKAGLSSMKELDESKKAEKILDDLVKFWQNELAPPSPQAKLF